MSVSARRIWSDSICGGFASRARDSLLAKNLKKVYNMMKQKSQKGADTIIMKRKIYQQLLDWKEKRNGEVALLIEGARRVPHQSSAFSERTSSLPGLPSG